jgi:hypothetical protein
MIIMSAVWWMAASHCINASVSLIIATYVTVIHLLTHSRGWQLRKHGCMAAGPCTSLARTVSLLLSAGGEGGGGLPDMTMHGVSQ